MRKNGMGSHQSAKAVKTEWLTPPWVLEKLIEFDLDPCAPVNRPWDMAKNHYTVLDNGLQKEWFGRVWLNPPYDNAGQWLSRLHEHGNGIALIFARTETEVFFSEVWNKADAILFIKNRLFFHHVTGERAKSNGGAPSVLIAYGKEMAECLKKCSIEGKFFYIK